MLVYLAGPIDLVGAHERKMWREEAGARLFGLGIGTFSPLGAFHCPTERLSSKACDAMIAINNSAVFHSDVVLANLSGRSFGTPLECMWAHENHIPVVALGVSKHSIYRHLVRPADDMVDAVAQITGLREQILEFRGRRPT